MNKISKFPELTFENLMKKKWTEKVKILNTITFGDVLKMTKNSSPEIKKTNF